MSRKQPQLSPLERGEPGTKPPPPPAPPEFRARKKPAGTEEPYLTVEDVADRLKMPAASIYRLVSAGKIPHYRFHRKAIRFRASDLEDWARQHKET